MPRALRTVRRAPIRLAMRPMLGAALALLGACGHRATIETGLNKDVALADQLQRRNAPALVSTQELAAPAPAVTHAVAPAPIVHTRIVTRTTERAPAAAHADVRTAVPAVVPAPPSTRAVPTTVDRATEGEVVAAGPAATPERGSAVRDGGYDAGVYRGDSQSTVASSETSAPIYRQPPQAHAARDGVFGSIAGAIIGAAASHGDRVRGGLLGAVAGGALGAVYGHSVDRTYADAGSAYPTYRPSASYRRIPRYRGTI